MEMEDQYGMADFRPYTDGRANFPAIRATGDLFSGHRNLTQAQHYEMVMMGRPVSHEVPPGLHDHHHHHHQFRSDSTTTTTTTTSTNSLNGLENMEGGGIGGDGGTGRWPRQETLTLLEIRSRLDSKFKEANQKGPLWDEVSRIMYEEHGYQRSGKKCREKFENLYKYYKKTKDGKAGRQDGKHYRFFRQLEALYGETSNPSSVSETHLVGNSFRFHNASNTTTISNQEAFQAPKLSESLSLSSSSEFNSSSSDDNDANAAVLKDIDSTEKRKKRRGKRSWKAKISDFIDTQMRKLMEKQEEWLEKMMKSMERKEEERIVREEEWRKQEAARIDREHKFWANERAWIESRDAALMEALQKLTGKKELMEPELRSLKDNQISNENGGETITDIVNGDHSWPECEITKLMQLRDVMESRFQQSGCIEEILWEEIAAKMAYLGYDRSALMCKDKWDSINNYLRKTKECTKKRKENSRSCCYFPNHELIYNQGGAYCEINEQEGPHTTRFATNDSASPPNSNTGNAMHDSCFRLLMGDGGNLWETYGVKHSKGENH